MKSQQQQKLFIQQRPVLAEVGFLGAAVFKLPSASSTIFNDCQEKFESIVWMLPCSISYKKFDFHFFPKFRNRKGRRREKKNSRSLNYLAEAEGATVAAVAAVVAVAVAAVAAVVDVAVADVAVATAAAAAGFGSRINNFLSFSIHQTGTADPFFLHLRLQLIRYFGAYRQTR